MGTSGRRPPTRRDYLRQLFSWRLLRESWDRAQSVAAAIGLVVAGLAALLPPARANWPWWWVLIPFGGLLLFGLFNVAYLNWRELEQLRASIEAGPPALEDDLDVKLRENSVPHPVGPYKTPALIARFADRKARGLVGFHVRVEELQQVGATGWEQCSWFRPFYLTWASGRTQEDVPPSGDREAPLAVVLVPGRNPHAAMGGINGINHGRYRVRLTVEEARHQVWRPWVEFVFEPDPAASPQTSTGGSLLAPQFTGLRLVNQLGSGGAGETASTP